MFALFVSLKVSAEVVCKGRELKTDYTNPVYRWEYLEYRLESRAIFVITQPTPYFQ